MISFYSSLCISQVQIRRHGRRAGSSDLRATVRYSRIPRAGGFHRANYRLLL